MKTASQEDRNGGLEADCGYHERFRGNGKHGKGLCVIFLRRDNVVISSTLYILRPPFCQNGTPNPFKYFTLKLQKFLGLLATHLPRVTAVAGACTPSLASL